MTDTDTRSDRRARRDAAVLAAAAGLTGLALGALGMGAWWAAAESAEPAAPASPSPVVTPWDGTMRGCMTEDDTNCYWDAAFMDNGDGRSFIDWGGTAYYPEAD